MKIYQIFLSKLYLKKFLLLFFAFEFFFTGIDLMQHLKEVPDSANLQILYGVNKFLEFFSYTLPLSLIFGLISAMLQIIKSNELVSLYALGVSKAQAAKPFVLLSFFISLIYILLNTIPGFVQTHLTTHNIKKHGTINNISSEIFIKSKNTYAYIGSLNPQEKKGEDIKIFITKNGDLKEIIEAKKGYFQKDHWVLQEIIACKKPLVDSKNLQKTKLNFIHYNHKEVLQGFTPHLIDTLFKTNTRLTIQDSFFAMKLFQKQSLKTNKIRANLYWMTVFPLFAPIVIFGLFFLMPIQHRGVNLTFFTTVSIFATLVLWGIVFTLSKIANNGSISPEAGIILPIILLFFVSFYIYKKYKN